MATFDLTHTGQEIDDAITAVKASGVNAAAWLTNLAFLNVTPGTAAANKAVVLDGSKQIDVLDVTGNLKSHTLFVVEGFNTRCVLRAVELRLEPGAVPETNINITQRATATHGFHSPTITGATNLAASGSSGSFSLSAGGTVVTMDLTENVVGIIGASTTTHDLNNSSTTELYVAGAEISGANILFFLRKRAGLVATDLRTILKAGDTADILISFITSS